MHSDTDLSGEARYDAYFLNAPREVQSLPSRTFMKINAGGTSVLGELVIHMIDEDIEAAILGLSGESGALCERVVTLRRVSSHVH